MILFFSLHQQWDDDEKNDEENENHRQVLRKKSVESVGGEKEKCNCFVIHEIKKNKKKT